MVPLELIHSSRDALCKARRGPREAHLIETGQILEPKDINKREEIQSTLSRENEGTERDIEGVGWDMSIPLKLFLGLDGNGSLFPQTSA